MGKFLLGVVVGVVVGVLATAYNPNLLEEVRVALANVTALVVRGTEEAAEAVGEAADEVADEAREAGGRATTDETPAEPTGTEQPVESTPPASDPPRTE